MKCMSHLEKHVNTMESPLHPLDDGLNRVKSSSSAHQEETLDTGLKIPVNPCMSIQHVPDRKLYMPESPPINNETTCNDKLTICLKNFQTPKLKRKSALDLDSIGKEYKDLLNSSVWDKYPRLLLHIKTALAGLDLTSLSGCVKNTIPTSWLTMQTLNLKPQMKSSLKTSLLSHIPLAVECTGIENSALKPPKIKRKAVQTTVDPKTLYASAKVDILKLTPVQKQYFSKLSFGYNIVYNRGVSILKHHVDNHIQLDPSTLRDVILRDFKSFKYTENQTKFLKSMPNRVKEKAAENIASIVKATKTNWTKGRYNKRKKPKKRKPRPIVDHRPQCTYTFKTGLKKNMECAVRGCKRHTTCETDGCTCLARVGFKQCKKHCDTTKEKKCKQPTCKYEDCNVETPYDYCLNHAVKLNVKVKHRNRKSNKIVTLNERDWDTLIRRVNDIKTVEGTVIEKPKSEFTILYHRQRKEWRIVSLEYKTKPDEGDKKLLCSLDPGERVPYTLYSFDDGECVELSSRENVKSKIIKLKDKCTRLREDKCQASRILMSKEKKRELQRINRNINRTTSKVSNRIKDAHWKLARMICSTYSHVILPYFKTSSIVKNKLASSVKQSILAFRHFHFIDVMKATAAKFNTCLVLGTEFYTTKCCLMCRRLTDIGPSKIYKCRFEDCNFEGPRDVVSAINNGIQYIR